MKKRVIIPIIIFSLIFLTACSNLDLSRITNLFSSGNQVVSSKGVTIEFFQFPKNEINENVPFSVGIRISNYNTNPVDGILCLEDRVPQRMGGFTTSPDSCKDISLEAAQDYDNKITPDKQEYFFQNKGYQNLRSDVTQQASITYYFKYIINEQAISQICVRNPNIDPAKLKQQTGVSCEDSESLSIKQPELPIKVSSVEKSTSNLGNNKVLMNIRVRLTQNEQGDIISEENVRDSSLNLNPVITFVPELTNNQVIFTCSKGLGNNKYEMKESEKVINCFTTLDMGRQDSVIDNLVINLAYGFRKSGYLSPINLISSKSLVA